MDSLSDLSIESFVFRAELYRSILEHVATANNSDLVIYEVRQDEESRPDLVSFRAYKRKSLAWVVSLVCGNDDSLESLPVGHLIKLPDIPTVRTMIREIKELSVA